MQALRDDVIVKVYYEEKSGSIYIPEGKALRERITNFYGEVISIGADCKLDIKPGDKVIFPRREGRKFRVEGEYYYRLKERWVYAKVDDAMDVSM